MRKINTLDLMLLMTIVFSATGFLFARADNVALNKVVKGKANISIEVSLPNVTSTKKELFKVEDEVGVTIRNRPYTKLKILKIEVNNKKEIIVAGSGVSVIDDPRQENTKDYVVTLTDEALVTKDGYSIGGNKIKIGNSIELEGFDFRLKGKVINVYSTPND